MSFVTLLVLMWISSSPQQSTPACKLAKDAETTYWGHERVLLSGEAKVNSIQGKIFEPNDDPMADALVEVFDHPGVAHQTLDAEIRAKKQRRVAACKTGQDGRFRFRGIPPGKYEVRVSKIGFDPTSAIVAMKARPQRRTHSEIRIGLQLSN